MKTPMRLALVMIVIASVAPALSAVYCQGPVSIHEETPGLLAQANMKPALARLAAFGEFPGAQLIAAEIKREGTHLVYSFELNVGGREANEQVQIDAATGQVLFIDYAVDQYRKPHIAPTAPPELESMVELGLPAARDAACATARDARVLGCKLRVAQSTTVYIFDLDVGVEHVLQQAVIDANTGVVVPTRQPR